MVSSKQHIPNQPLLRSHILDAARAIVVRQGFAALSMRKLAEVIGYSPASLYLHFAGRDAIAHALCVESHAQLLAALHEHDGVADPGARLKAVAYAYVNFGRAHPQMYRLIFMDDPAYTDAAFSNAAPVLSLLTKALALSSSGNPSATAETLWAALHGIVSLSLTAGKYLITPVDTLIGRTLDLYALDVKKKPVRRRLSARAA